MIDLKKDSIGHFVDYCRLSVNFAEWQRELGGHKANASFAKMVVPVEKALRRINKKLEPIGWEVVVRRRSEEGGKLGE